MHSETFSFAIIKQPLITKHSFDKLSMVSPPRLLSQPLKSPVMHNWQ